MRQPVRSFVALAALAAAVPAWADGGFTIAPTGFTSGIYLSTATPPAEFSTGTASNSLGGAIGSNTIPSVVQGSGAWVYSNGNTVQIGLSPTNTVYGNPARPGSDGAFYGTVLSLGGTGVPTFGTSTVGANRRFVQNTVGAVAAGTFIGSDAWIYDGTTTTAVPLPTSTNTSTTDPAAYIYSVTSAPGVTYEDINGLFTNGNGVAAGAQYRFPTNSTTTSSSGNIGYDAWVSNGTVTKVTGLSGSDYSYINGALNVFRQSTVSQVNAGGLVVGVTGYYGGINTTTAQAQEPWLYDPNHPAASGGFNGTMDLQPPAPDGNTFFAASGNTGNVPVISNSGKIAITVANFNNGTTNRSSLAPKNYLAGFVYDAVAQSWTKVGLYYNALDPATALYATTSGTQGTQISSTNFTLNNMPVNALGQVIGTTTRQSGTTGVGTDAWVYYPAGNVPINAAAGSIRVGLTGGVYERNVTVNSAVVQTRTSSITLLSNAGGVAGTSIRWADPTGVSSTGQVGQDAFVYDPAHGITTVTRIGLTPADSSIYELPSGFTNNTINASILAINNTGEVGGFSKRYDSAIGARGQDAWVFDSVSHKTYSIDPNSPILPTAWSSTITSISDSGLVLGYDATSTSATPGLTASKMFAWFLGGPLHDQPHFMYLSSLPGSASMSDGSFSVNSQTSVYSPPSTAGVIFGTDAPTNAASGSTMTFALTPKAVTYNGMTSAWDSGSANTIFTYDNPTNGTSPTVYSFGVSATFGNLGVGAIAVDPTGVYVSSMNVTNASGTYTFTGGSVGGGTLTKSGAGIVNFAGGAWFGSTTLNGGVAVIPQLGATAGGSFLMNAGSKMVVSGGDTASLTALLKQGLSSANDWSGTGITAGTPAISGGAATHGIGILTAAQWSLLHGSAAFGDYTVQSGDVLLRYGYMGDATLDGVISSDDYLQVDYGFLHASTGWFNGDFNYDGLINAVDYALIDKAFSLQSGSLADGEIALHAAEFGQAYTDAFNALSLSAVPEPASLMLLGLGALGLIRRRNAR